MDTQLVDRARHGDKEAFTALVLELGDNLYSVAYRILRDADQAEDAVQQALLIAWRQLPQLRDADRFEAWLYRVLVNVCRREIRRTPRWVAGLHLLDDVAAATPDVQLTTSRRDELERGFRRLSVEHRAVLVLHHYLGLSGSEIGDALGLSPGTVRSRLHYARQAMRASLDADARSVAHGGTA